MVSSVFNWHHLQVRIMFTRSRLSKTEMAQSENGLNEADSAHTFIYLWQGKHFCQSCWDHTKVLTVFLPGSLLPILTYSKYHKSSLLFVILKFTYSSQIHRLVLLYQDPDMRLLLLWHETLNTKSSFLLYSMDFLLC